MAIILRAVAKQLGVIVSPIELVAQSGSNVIAAAANYHSTLGSVILLGPDGTEDAAAPPPPPAISAPSMPSSGHQSRAVAKPPPFPPPHRGGQSAMEKGVRTVNMNQNLQRSLAMSRFLKRHGNVKDASIISFDFIEFFTISFDATGGKSCSTLYLAVA